MTQTLSDYAVLLRDIKGRIQGAQSRATAAANRELIFLYWDVGRMLAARQESQGWGAAVIPQLARDLASDLPGAKGFSERNLKRMVRFSIEYQWLEQQPPIVPQPVAQLETERHNRGALGTRSPILPPSVTKLSAESKVPQLVAQIASPPSDCRFHRRCHCDGAPALLRAFVVNDDRHFAA